MHVIENVNEAYSFYHNQITSYEPELLTFSLGTHLTQYVNQGSILF